MKKIIIAVGAFLFAAFSVTALFADITVKSIKGEVALKSGKRWVALAEGSKLQKGDRLSTGVNSSAVIVFSRATVTVRPMSIVEIKESEITTLTDSTVIGLNRGGINAKVQKGDRVKTSFRISTPVATSSVRGTEEEVSYGPSGMTIRVIEGVIEGRGFNSNARLVRGNLRFDQRSDKSLPDSFEENLRDDYFGSASRDVLSDDEKANVSIGSGNPASDDYRDGVSGSERAGTTSGRFRIEWN